MIDFEHFVKDLGPYAKNYSQEELRQLYIEIRKFADILLARQKVIAERQVKHASRKPLDVPAAGHMLESHLTERVDEDGKSRGP